MADYFFEKQLEAMAAATKTTVLSVRQKVFQAAWCRFVEGIVNGGRRPKED